MDSFTFYLTYIFQNKVIKVRNTFLGKRDAVGATVMGMPLLGKLSLVTRNWTFRMALMSQNT
jgi:hypothetical protein